MPNWITNILEVKGPAEDVEKFYKAVCPDEFENFYLRGTVPMPEELVGTTSPTPKGDNEKTLELIKKYGAGNWYDWSIQNWGCKWDTSDSHTPETIDNGMRFRFNTPWGPPDQWVINTIKKFPSLEFTDSWIDDGGGAGIFFVASDNGISHVEEQSISDHDWKIKYDEYYKEEFLLITEGDYKDVLESYQNEEYANYSELDEFLLKRLKDSDLPLFITYDWGYLQETYERRIKNEKVYLPKM